MENVKKYWGLSYLVTWDCYRLEECRTFLEVSERLKDYVAYDEGDYHGKH